MKPATRLENFKRKFGRYVKSRRIEMGWSQEFLADLMGNNAQNVSRLERGEINPTLYWCLKLAVAFEETLGEFINKFDGEKKEH